jgi:alpha-glucosidase
MARRTYEGARASMDNKRPFVLTRAGYSGCSAIRLFDWR